MKEGADPALEPPPPAEAGRVLERLQVAGFEAYFVGGCVRDRLLGRAVADWDVTTDARPEQVVALFEHVVPTGIAHGTVTVVAPPFHVEVTTYRVELGYSDGRRPDNVAFTAHLSLDLERRDFTMNAMAWDPRRNLLVDLHGGQADLAARVVRAVGDPDARFSEDGLRALRAVRFAAVLGLEIEPETWGAIGRTLDVFRRVSAERIQVELVKTLCSRRPGWGGLRLGESGLLGCFLRDYPLGALPAVAHALDRSGGALELRLALFLSPLGLGGAEAALDGLRFSHQVRTAVLAVLRTQSLQPSAADTPAAVRALVAEIGRETLDRALAYHAAALTPDWNGLAERIEAAGARSVALTTKELALDGREVMRRLGIPPSRRVGRLLDALLRHVWRAPELNTVDGLAGLLPQVAAEVPEGGA